jgi:hypothetical protein
MASVNQFNPRIDQTVHIYDRFYDYEDNVPADQYDAVISYFKSVMKTDEQAGDFATALFRVAEQSGDNVMTVLQSLQGLTGLQLTLQLCYYLNGTRSNATLLGVLQPTAPNYWTARNVRQ